MPALSELCTRDIASNFTLAPPALANSSIESLKVICAWPVSGQYGPGSRILYYALIAACVLARRVKWLVDACLPAALLFPAVAAIHGIVLSAVHKDGAVDLDIYGSFQFCSMGIVAAPVTVMLSHKYFHVPGRNTIFLWVALILVGLICLAVEFYRIDAKECVLARDGVPLESPRSSNFPYEENDKEGGNGCKIICDTDSGPHSPIRGGSANNIYLIPAPESLNFGLATFLAAACCVHAILCLLFMWKTIVEFNGKQRFTHHWKNKTINQPIEGPKGIKNDKMFHINSEIRLYMIIVATFIFGGAGVALLILGEINFFSRQVRYQTEPMASIGQWAPMAGTGLALLGSLYVILARDIEKEKKKAQQENRQHHCRCPHHNSEFIPSPDIAYSLHDQGLSRPAGTLQRPYPEPLQPLVTRGTNISLHASAEVAQGMPNAGNRRRVAQAFMRLGDLLGHPPPELDDPFRHGHVIDYPDIPGENLRNERLEQTSEAYSHNVEADARRSQSRSRNSERTGVETPSGSSRSSSPQQVSSSRPRSATLPARGSSSRSRSLVVHQSLDEGRFSSQGARLEVPSPSSRSPSLNRTSASRNFSDAIVTEIQSPLSRTHNSSARVGQQVPATPSSNELDR